MQNATSISLSSQTALQRQMDVVANNLANLSTPGYKAEEMLFTQHLTHTRGTGTIAFVEDAGTARDLRQGPISKTGNPLDFALQGPGYFSVETPLGTRYTRAGHFQLDAQHQLVTSEGYPVLAAGGQPLALPSNINAVTVGTDGTVSASQAGSSSQSSVGKLQVVTFAAPQLVTPAANGLYVTDQTPDPATTATTTVQQGMIEESNVQPVVELTRLMAVSRNSGAIKNVSDEESQRQGNAYDKLSKVY
ncbi:MAG TPA: flagellar basal-body rod protein FlgF [Stellaceae bacterium]|jgi:flagellar basal-body rod protein FlgF|nr:flagellar basal-body rod protein FlgF [Stellaceae bacterium]